MKEKDGVRCGTGGGDMHDAEHDRDYEAIVTVL